MQITLVQTEIEQAIRDYVGNQLRVADGMEMSIDLSATRGAEGFKATIDIHPIGDTAAKQEQPKAAAATVTVVKPAFTARPVAAPNAALVEAAQETEKLNEPVSANAETAPFDGGTTNVEAQAEAPATAEDNADAPAAEEAPAASRSLFKGLAKPRNN